VSRAAADVQAPAESGVDMTRAGRLAAEQFGSTLPTFRDLAEAERVLYARRDELLRELVAVAPRSSSFQPDFSPESLKGLERWYFELEDGAGFGVIGADEETFERAMAMYLGEVLVRNASTFEWFVTEFAFEQGRYEIGVRAPLFALMLSRQRFPPRERNRRQESMWRMYQTALPSR
jgi:hypothetical protein